MTASVIFVLTVIVEAMMERLRMNGDQIGTKWYKGETKMVKRKRWAYIYGAYFEWSDLKGDYIKQLELPVEYFAKRYGISPYDKPMGCYRIIYLEDLIGRFRKNKKKMPVIYQDSRVFEDGTDALIARTMMEDRRHEQIHNRSI